MYKQITEIIGHSFRAEMWDSQCSLPVKRKPLDRQLWNVQIEPCYFEHHLITFVPKIIRF